MSITLADEKLSYATEVKSQMSHINTKRFSFSSYSHAYQVFGNSHSCNELMLDILPEFFEQ